MCLIELAFQNVIAKKIGPIVESASVRHDEAYTSNQLHVRRAKSFA
jgi:hypothetical protein